MTLSSSTAAIVESLYVDHSDWLRARLRRKLGNISDAADLMQSTFLRVLTAPGLDRIVEPRAYLTTIARNLLANHLRRQAIEQAYAEALALLPEQHSPAPEVRLMALEVLVEVDRLLAGLPLQAKQAFLMAQIDGLSHGEIATQLGISVATVKRRIAQAAQRCYFGA